MSQSEILTKTFSPGSQAPTNVTPVYLLFFMLVSL